VANNESSEVLDIIKLGRRVKKDSQAVKCQQLLTIRYSRPGEVSCAAIFVRDENLMTMCE